jgi:hypothetical protein
MGEENRAIVVQQPTIVAPGERSRKKFASLTNLTIPRFVSDIPMTGPVDCQTGGASAVVRVYQGALDYSGRG